MANPANSTMYRLSNGPFAGNMAVDVTEAKTLGIADSGIVQMVKYDNAVVTLPATATQGIWPIVAAGVPLTSGPVGVRSDGSMKLSVSPNASDKIQGGPDGTATDDKDLILVKATMLVNDYALVQNTGETNGPVVVRFTGVWSREA
jgi:hypothetical protein